MPRPSIKTPNISNDPKTLPTKPNGLPKPRARPKPAPENTALSEAQAAVGEFEVQHRLLLEMKQDWGDNFPEARLALEDIKRQEDVVVDAIKRAKPLVAECKETIGDFKTQRKFSKPHYDPIAVTKLVTELEDGLAILDDMLKSGIVKVIDLESSAALAWFAQRPDYSEAFQSAFMPEEELTTAVTVPKI